MALPISISRRAPADNAALSIEFDASLEALWVFLEPIPGRPLNFSTNLLGAFERLLDRIEENRWHWQSNGASVPVRYLVLASHHPRYFALGGDLAFFQQCIATGNFGALRAYSMRCLELIQRIFGAAENVTTIALVQGRALGGGFEAALSATHLIAERNAEFGFPEIAFGTFPCTGAMSLLSNRIELRRAAAFLRNPAIHTAESLHALGVIDELGFPGEGPAAARRFIADHRRRYNARMAIQRAEARLGALDMVELRRVVEDWVATAMALSPDERRVLDTLVRMQAADATRPLTLPTAPSVR